MSKKHATATIEFKADGNELELGAVRSNFLELKQGQLRFIHIERKGNTWLLLDAMGIVAEMPDSYTVTWGRNRTDEKRHFTLADRQYEIAIYTVLNLGLDKPFYHLDELPDGTWRLCHTEGFLSFEHENLEKIIMSKDGIHV